MDDNSPVLVGLVVRWAHLVASVLVVGAPTALLLAGHSERPTARQWEARVGRLTRVVLAVAVALGLAALAWQTALVEGRPAAALDSRALLRFALQTQSGQVWLARHGLLVLLAAFAALGTGAHARVDWLALRGEAVLLGATALVLLALAGHAAAVEPNGAAAIVVDTLHLGAAGLWIGALPPLALLLRATSRADGADARPYAVRAARRFSRLALVAVVALAATGIVNAATQVGSVAGLVGTPYGRWLLLKLGLVAATLVVAAVNRRRLLPAIGGDAETVGRPAMRRLAGLLLLEAGLALALLAAVAALGLTPPARHVQPSWPFSFRLALGALASAGDRWRALVGSQIAVLAIAVIAAWLITRWRRPAVLAAALALAVVGVAIALPPLALDAYPTTYVRPAVPYQAASIMRGTALYREHCALCHAARALPWARVERHTAGDLYWWITRGVPAARMPGFADRLDENARWDLVNFVRTLDAARAADGVGPVVEPDRAWLVAPDFEFAVGPTPPQTLRDYRGRRLVVLVIYSLPFSRPRLVQLAENQNLLSALGAEVIVVPRDGAPDAIKRLGDDPRILFQIVTGGADAIVAGYDMFGPARHAEYLIDRQGYIRTRWAAGDDPWRDVDQLLANVQQLNQERVAAAPPDEHVH